MLAQPAVIHQEIGEQHRIANLMRDNRRFFMSHNLVEQSYKIDLDGLAYISYNEDYPYMVKDVGRHIEVWAPNSYSPFDVGIHPKRIIHRRYGYAVPDFDGDVEVMIFKHEDESFRFITPFTPFERRNGYGIYRVQYDEANLLSPINSRSFVFFLPDSVKFLKERSIGDMFYMPITPVLSQELYMVRDIANVDDVKCGYPVYTIDGFDDLSIPRMKNPEFGWMQVIRAGARTYIAVDSFDEDGIPKVF